MAKGPIVKSPFSDAVCGHAVPKRGDGSKTYDHEPNLPGGIAGRSASGNGLPEVMRDSSVGGSAKRWPEPGKNLKNLLGK